MFDDTPYTIPGGATSDATFFDEYDITYGMIDNGIYHYGGSVGIDDVLGDGDGEYHYFDYGYDVQGIIWDYYDIVDPEKLESMWDKRPREIWLPQYDPLSGVYPFDTVTNLNFESYIDWLERDTDEFLEYNREIDQEYYAYQFWLAFGALSKGRAGEYYNHYTEKVADKWGTNPLSFMGAGWALNFTNIQIDDVYDEKYVKFADGSTYKYKEGDNYSNLENYKLQDVKMTEDRYAAYPGSRYTLSYADGKREYFDAAGNIVAIVDRYGNTIKFAISGSNITITDTNNNVTTITLSGSTYTITLPDQSKYEYSVTRNGSFSQLASKVDPLGNRVSYSYSGKTGLVDYVDYAPVNYPGDASKFEAKAANHLLLTSISHPTGVVTEYSYDKRTGKLGNEDGFFEYYSVSERHDNADGRDNNRVVYDYSGDYTGYGKTSVYNFSQTATSDSGAVTVSNFTGRNFKKSNSNIPGYENDEDDEGVRGEIKLISEEVYDGSELSVKTSYVYDSRNLPTSITLEKHGDSVSSAIQLFEYDNKGNVTASWSTLANGTKDSAHKTTYVYGAYNILLEKSYNQDASSPIREAYTLTSDSKSVASAKVYDGSKLAARADFVYNTKGQLTTQRDFYSGSSNYQTSISYSGAMPISVTTGGVSQSYTYDKMGRTLTSTDGNGYKTSYQYDALGRLKRTTNPDGSYNTSAYNDTANTVTITNEIGSEMRYSYDPLGNTETVEDATGGKVLNTFVYDNLGRMTSANDALGNETRYTYDTFGRTLSVSQGNLYKESYSYNDANSSGNSVVTKTVEGDTNAPSVKSTVHTDKHGNVVRDSVYDGSTELYSTYSYDYVGNRISEQNARDRAEGRSFTAQYEYDHAGNVTKLIQADGYSYQTVYDSIGRKFSETDPKGGIFKYGYDALSRLTREELPFDGSQISAKIYTYDKNGNMTEEKVSTNLPGRPQYIPRLSTNTTIVTF